MTWAKFRGGHKDHLRAGAFNVPIPYTLGITSSGLVLFKELFWKSAAAKGSVPFWKPKCLNSERQPCLKLWFTMKDKLFENSHPEC